MAPCLPLVARRLAVILRFGMDAGAKGLGPMRCGPRRTRALAQQDPEATALSRSDLPLPG